MRAKRWVLQYVMVFIICSLSGACEKQLQTRSLPLASQLPVQYDEVESVLQRTHECVIALLVILFLSAKASQLLRVNSSQFSIAFTQETNAVMHVRTHVRESSSLLSVQYYVRTSSYGCFLILRKLLFYPAFLRCLAYLLSEHSAASTTARKRTQTKDVEKKLVCSSLSVCLSVCLPQSGRQFLHVTKA